MGDLADALRSSLRSLAQADARLLRELDQALPADGLDGLTVLQLKERRICAIQRATGARRSTGIAIPTTRGA